MERDEVIGLTLAYIGIFVIAAFLLTVKTDTKTGDFILTKPELPSTGGILGNQAYIYYQVQDYNKNYTEVQNVSRRT